MYLFQSSITHLKGGNVSLQRLFFGLDKRVHYMAFIHRWQWFEEGAATGTATIAVPFYANPDALPSDG